ncbi:MAG: hypothetical protein ACKODX_19890, partial [Gemmata sp.]
QNGARRFRLTPASLRRATEPGRALADIDSWFIERSGAPLSPAGRLLLLGAQMPAPQMSRLLVVQFPTPDLTEGVVQWPGTRALVGERLGPLAVSVAEENFDAFRAALRELGVQVKE